MVWVMAVLLALPAAAPSSELTDARAALDAKDYPRAVELLEKTVAEKPENFPGDFEIHFDLAFAYTQLEQDEKAIEHYRKAVEKKPDLIPARLNLAMVLLRRQRPADAAPHLKAVIDARPDDAGLQHMFARALFDSERFEEAIPAFQRAAEMDPASADARLGLGQSLARLDRFDEAARAYREAAALNAEFAQMTLELGELHESKGRVEQAVALYREYLAAHPQEVAVRERIGFLLLNLKRYPEAIEVLETAVRDNPSVANRAALAQAHSMNDQPAKALPLLREAVAGEPSNADLRVRYANLLLHSQEFVLAAQNYLEAVKNSPDLLDGWNGLAFSLFRVENYQGTLKALAESARLGPEKPAGVYLRALAQDKLQMYPEALASYESFLTLGSGLEDEEWKAGQRIIVIKKVLHKSGR